MVRLSRIRTVLNEELEYATDDRSLRSLELALEEAKALIAKKQYENRQQQWQNHNNRVQS